MVSEWAEVKKTVAKWVSWGKKTKKKQMLSEWAEVKKTVANRAS